MRMVDRGKMNVVVYGKRLLALLSILFASAVQAFPCDQPIVISNWKSCYVGELSDKGGDADWQAVPEWTRDKAVYFGHDPRALANHGLCNAKFRRVALCWAGWEMGDPDEWGRPTYCSLLHPSMSTRL
ncbi:hypothetical protein [Rhizobium leguminosarum]|uniref:hypothetical protein n=1 Tax=Rhizobium leguminosarum TaxID=384 RepID=UPI0014413022|nr:hypothetical protein [Rhizobium leguminosarum]MBY5869606.1 hypothetical protein [Rhizobium leguminosarum]NKM08933.1 hypothetical protein [Rhizobium leguminosarum bv. viciae]